MLLLGAWVIIIIGSGYIIMIYYHIASGYIIMIYYNIGSGYIIMIYYHIGAGNNYYDLL